MIARILALVAIFICTTIAWIVLGSTIFYRTDSSRHGLSGKVASIWGSPQEQKAPTAGYFVPGPKPGDKPACIAIPIESSDIDVRLDLDYRQKGLLWYSTYRVAFKGVYEFRNDAAEPREVSFWFPFPADQAIYDDLAFTLDGRPLPTDNASTSISAKAEVPAGATVKLGIGYKSQGLETWKYAFGGNVAKIRNFALRLRTNFRDPDFPENSLSPTSKRQSDGGWDLEWNYKNLVSGFQIAVACPEKLQPGPLAAQISYFAPVSLFFFFFLIFMITTMRGIDLHPMNYFFLATAFFAFHLLLAYLVDHISIHAAFVICSAVSIFLVVSYLRLVVGMKFAIREAAAVQLVYLVLFSYAFFFKGLTGLSITIGAIVTLFIVMQATGRIRWQEKFVARPA